MQADDPVPDSEHGDHGHLAVDLSDVLGQHGGRLGWHARLWAAGELHAGFADQGDPETWLFGLAVSGIAPENDFLRPPSPSKKSGGTRRA